MQSSSHSTLSRTKTVLRAIVGLLWLTIAVAAAQAQAPLGDFPEFQGSSARTGRNMSAQVTSPGRGNLTWYTPFSSRPYRDLNPRILDNTDFLAPGPYAAYPPNFDDPAGNGGAAGGTSFGSFASSSPTYGFAVGGVSPFVNAWAGPKEDQEASFPYLEVVNPYGAATSDSNTRTPPYVYTACTASDTNGDPTQPANPSALRTFTWTFGADNGSANRTYAVYVYLPIGPTYYDNGTGKGDTSGEIFPQRYFVYKVSWGGGSYTDVVDTYAAGSGWVRLGNGGLPTNVVFPYDGVNPITVTLYNTVPRDSSGNLTTVTSTTKPENYCVYADAAKIVPVSGYYTATPTVSAIGSTDIRTVAALNTVTTSFVNGVPVNTTRGVVSSYVYNFTDQINPQNNTRWTYTPFLDTNGEGDIDNSSSVVLPGNGWAATTGTQFINGDALVSPGSVDPNQVTFTSYSPALQDGQYDVYAYLPGGTGYGSQIRYDVLEGSTVTSFTLDQSSNQGWVRLGARKFVHDSAHGQPLVVHVTNFDAKATETGAKVYADAIRFQGTASLAVHSTPIQATVNIRKDDGTLVSTAVVLVADDAGRIHCLDATGRGDGTTTEYWCYPSRKRDSTYIDPNISAGIDGPATGASPTSVPIAQMPTGFNLSSAVIQQIGATSYLYIASTNGRVYCIDMTGRGDYVTTSNMPGTTQRIWSFPSDYPGAIQSTSLGGSVGALVYANTAAGPTIYVPDTTGRIYALDALPTGAPTTGRTTDLRWAFPSLNAANLGSIQSTPAYDFGRLFFGTLQKNGTSGRFFSLDAATGAEQWVFPSDAQVASGGGVSDFTCSPATVPGTELGSGDQDTVYVLNQNKYVYALPADGTGDRTPIWTSNELQTGSHASLGYTRLDVFDKSGTGTIQTDARILMVPTDDGRFDGLYARSEDTNIYGSHLAFEHVAQGDTIQSSMSFGRGFMYGADSAGFLYAFSNDALGGYYSNGGWSPGQNSIVPNDPTGAAYRKAKIGLINQATYQSLRLPAGTTGHPAYGDVIDSTDTIKSSAAYTGTNGPPWTFEWGQTVYLLVYDFPFDVLAPDGTTTVPPPMVNISFSVAGQTVRSIPVEARIFENPASAPTDQTSGKQLSGYAILAYTFQGGGPNALPPGNATVSVSISTQALGATRQPQNIVLNPATSTAAFQLANPLGVLVVPSGSGAVPPTDLNPNASGSSAFYPYSVGLSAFPDNPENLVNGSPVVSMGAAESGDPDKTSKAQDHLLASAGTANHGSTTSATVYVYDRSMMGLIRPDGNGLDNVRVGLGDLAWQGSSPTVFHPLPAAYNGFEDLPVNYPNVSLDYPNIKRANISVTKDPNGDAENPLFNGVTLKAPLGPDGNPMTDATDPKTRIWQLTPFVFNITVPKYQPPNRAYNYATNSALQTSTSTIDDPADPAYFQLDSNGKMEPQGYLSRVNVFVDSSQNGILDMASREAYRSLNLSTAVAPDIRLSVATPTVNLGSLAEGAGWPVDRNGFGGTTSAPGLGSFLFSNYPGLFQPIEVHNDGNVNLIDVRLAKSSSVTTPSPVPAGFTDAKNDDQAWLNGLFDLWANFDVNNAPAITADRRQIVQKARPGDTSPTQLQVNPQARANPGLGVVGGTTAIGGPSLPPEVGVSVPIGFPVGSYLQHLWVIENNPNADNSALSNENWDFLNSTGANDLYTAVPEPYSDPGFDLSFTVRESRLTNTYTTGAAPMIDNLLGPTMPTYVYRNQQPAAMRDLTGSMLVAWASDRPSDTPSPGAPSTQNTNTATRIYLSGLQNQFSFSNPSITLPNGIQTTSPLADLDFFAPSTNGTWFTKSSSTSGGYPSSTTDLGTLFGVGSGDTIASASFGNPAFPTTGALDAYDPTKSSATVPMVFTGDAVRQTATGRVGVSRLFVAQVTTNGGKPTIGNPVPLPYDDQTGKGKASVLAVTGSGDDIIFYPGQSTGTSTIYETRYNGGKFTPPTALPFGDGFETVTSPSAIARYALSGQGNQVVPVIDLAFTGKLRGRTAADLYVGRLAVDAQTLHLPEAADGTVSSTSFIDQPTSSYERLALDNGVYRARGIQWDLTQPIQLVQVLNNATTNLLDVSTRTVDPQSGLISYETTLGGRVTLDPALGTVRFSNTSPSRNAELRLTYTPRFTRISDTAGSGYSGATMMFDTRTISNFQYWRTASGAAASSSDVIPNDRYVFVYGRGAGSGLSAQPVMTTMRLGVRLTTPILTDGNGVVQNLSVSGNTGPYEVDPANGRVYFTRADEGHVVTIQYQGVDITTGTGLRGTLSVQAQVGMVLEKSEAQIPIEQAVNESNVAAFLDPFDVQSSDMNRRRPPLVWLFWTSSRSGSPDLYFESVATRMAPVPLGGK